MDVAAPGVVVTGGSVIWWIDDAHAEEPAGYAVIAGVPQPDEGAALAAMGTLLSAGLPQHDEYPLVAPLDAYGGSGFGIIVAIPAVKDVADKLVSTLRARHIDASVHSASGPPEDLRIIAIDAVKITGNGAPLYPYSICLALESSGDCLATGSLDDLRRLALPFDTQRPGTVLALRVTAGDPWTCPIATIGPVEREFTVWLKAPIDIACFEDSTPRKRKKDP